MEISSRQAPYIRQSILVIGAIITWTKGPMGRIAKNNRPFITGLFCIFSTGAAWPDLAERYGGWSHTPVDLLGGEIKSG